MLGRNFWVKKELEIKQQKKLNLLHVSSKNAFRSHLNMFQPIFSSKCSKVKLKSVSTPETSLGNGTALTQMTKLQYTGQFKTNYVDSVKYSVNNTVPQVLQQTAITFQYFTQLQWRNSNHSRTDCHLPSLAMYANIKKQNASVTALLAWVLALVQ